MGTVDTIVAPRSALESPDAATLYLHAVTQGEFYWRFQGVPGYDFARQQAENAHVSVTIDRLGYGASDKPPGLELLRVAGRHGAPGRRSAAHR